MRKSWNYYGLSVSLCCMWLETWNTEVLHPVYEVRGKCPLWDSAGLCHLYVFICHLLNQLVRSFLLEALTHHSDIKQLVVMKSNCCVAYTVRVRDGNSPYQQVALACMRHSVRKPCYRDRLDGLFLSFLFPVLSTVSHSWTASQSDLSHRLATPPIVKAQSS